MQQVFFSLTDMALPYEMLTAEERQLERAARSRRRETWALDEVDQRIQYRVATAVERLRQTLEDTAVAPVAATLAEETERWRTGVRSAVKQSVEIYKQLELGNKYGEEAVEKVIDKKEEVEGMSEEEAKRLKAFIRPTRGGGKITSSKRGAKSTINKRAGGAGGKNESDGAGSSAAGSSGYSAGAGNFGGASGGGWGWGPYPPPQQPYYPYMQAPWGGEGWQGSQSQYQQGRPGGGAASVTKAEKIAKYPCDNCGQTGHWSYSIECPNYETYLAKMRAKAEAAKGGKGVVALRTNTGKKKLKP